MYEIIKREQLAHTVIRIDVTAPLIAKKAKAGQFIILRVSENGERVPFTIADKDEQKGTIAIIFQVLGATTKQMEMLQVGDALRDLVGPLGVPSALEHLKKVAIVSGGVGGAVAYPLAKALYSAGAEIDIVCGFRNTDLVILQADLQAVSTRLITCTDDGSYGEKGFVTDVLKRLLEAGEVYDEIFVVGPLIMMKVTCLLTKQYNIKTTVSMNAIMIDGTGMCGCCRLSVGGKTQFACVDGPDFDGHLVDFAGAMERGNMYESFEHHAYEAQCNLFAKEV